MFTCNRVFLQSVISIFDKVTDLSTTSLAGRDHVNNFNPTDTNVHENTCLEWNAAYRHFSLWAKYILSVRVCVCWGRGGHQCVCSNVSTCFLPVLVCSDSAVLLASPSVFLAGGGRVSGSSTDSCYGETTEWCSATVPPFSVQFVWRHTTAHKVTFQSCTKLHLKTSGSSSYSNMRFYSHFTLIYSWSQTEEYIL